MAFNIVAVLVALLSLAGTIYATRKDKEAIVGPAGERLTFDVWKDSVSELRVRLEEVESQRDEFEGHFEECQRDLVKTISEVSEVRSDNRDLAHRVVELERRLMDRGPNG